MSIRNRKKNSCLTSNLHWFYKKNYVQSLISIYNLFGKNGWQPIIYIKSTALGFFPWDILPLGQFGVKRSCHRDFCRLGLLSPGLLSLGFLSSGAFLVWGFSRLGLSSLGLMSLGLLSPSHSMVPLHILSFWHKKRHQEIGHGLAE